MRFPASKTFPIFYPNNLLTQTLGIPLHIYSFDPNINNSPCTNSVKHCYEPETYTNLYSSTTTAHTLNLHKTFRPLELTDFSPQDLKGNLSTLTFLKKHYPTNMPFTVVVADIAFVTKFWKFSLSSTQVGKLKVYININFYFQKRTSLRIISLFWVSSILFFNFLKNPGSIGETALVFFFKYFLKKHNGYRNPKAAIFYPFTNI